MSNTDVARDYLQKRWICTEETDSELVYRPATSVPSQPIGRGGLEGRMQMEFRPDGTCTVSGVGPDDRPQKSECKWELEGNERLLLKIELGPKSIFALIITSVEPDYLLIKKE
jgi:hypothetical protein